MNKNTEEIAGEILFKYIDRLNDPCDEDSRELIITELLNEFDLTFEEIWKKRCSLNLSDFVIRRLFSNYTERKRFYHTLDHILYMFAFAAMNNIKLSRAQQLAILYHDAIYDPEKTDNEEKSARFLEFDKARIVLSDEEVEETVKIILSTINHLPLCESAKTVLDLDLISLAAEPANFKNQNINIKKEYAHLSHKDFYEKQNVFMKSLLDREFIFHTKWGRMLENKARENIKQLIKDNEENING